MRRKKRWFFLILIIVVVVGVILARREPTITPGSFLIVEIGGRYLEAQPSDIIGQLLGSRKQVLIDVMLELRKATFDDRLRGIIVKIRPTTLEFAQVQELRDLFGELKRAGKRVIAWVSGEDISGNTTYLLASAADKVYYSENTVLPVTGLRATYLFLGDLWKQFDIELQVEQIREYKTFGDFLTRRTMSEAHREMANSLLDSLQHQFITAIATSRGQSPAQVQTLLDTPTLTPTDLHQGGLIDGIKYFDELLEDLSAGSTTPVPTVSLATYGGVRPASVGLDGKEKIAVIFGVGAVTLGESDWSATGQSMGTDTLVRAFDHAAADDTIKAIVFRIDSPGGSALASDLIWRAVKTAKRRKPVIVSMSGVAASGGYYIAAGADKIVAQPATLTGSIGIVFMQPNIEGLLQKVGVGTESLARGKYARLFDPAKGWTDRERHHIKRLLEDLYQTFISKVADGRRMGMDEVDLLGRGRVWTGMQAKEQKLVDALGGMFTALALAKQAIGLERQVGVQLVFYPRPKRLLEALFDRLSLRVVESVGIPEPVTRFTSWLIPFTLMGQGALYAMPVTIQIR